MSSYFASHYGRYKIIRMGRAYEELEEENQQTALIEGNKAALSKYRNVPEARRKKEFRLRFPNGMSLTDEPFIEVGDAVDELEIEAHYDSYYAHTGQMETDDKGNQVPIQNLNTSIIWRLVDLESKVKLQSAGKKRKKAADKLAESLAKSKKTKMAHEDGDY